MVKNQLKTTNKNFLNFLEKANKLYNNFYSYNENSYVNCKTPIKVICPIHGEFLVTPDKHLNQKQECPYCKKESKQFKLNEKIEIKEKNKLLKQEVKKKEFYDKARRVHNGKYIYHDDYVNSKTKIKITCPEHGEFWQTPMNHLNGQGCPKCANQNKTQTTEEFINKARKIHGDKNDYSKVNYINAHTKVCIICPIHGEFWVSPSNHLKGKGCPKCAGRHKTTESVIEEFRKIHGDKYIYEEVNYIKANEKVKIICPIHGEFMQTPNKHLQGRGCPYCNNSHLEEQTFNLLKEMNIEFIKGYKPKWLNGKELDFYLPEYNITIECQGSQHFPTLDMVKNKFYLFTLEEMEKCVQRDIIKNQECKDNNVKLYYIIYYRIPVKTIINDSHYQGIYNKDSIIKTPKEIFDNQIVNED